LLNHNISFVKFDETMKNDVMNVGNYGKGFVGLIEVQPCKGLTKTLLDISFSSKYIVSNAPNGPLYIAV
jgi:hypothetical protein